MRQFHPWDTRSFLALPETVCSFSYLAKSLAINGVYIGPDYWIYGIKHPDSAMKRLFDAVSNFFKKEWFLFVAILAIALIITVFELL